MSTTLASIPQRSFEVQPTPVGGDLYLILGNDAFKLSEVEVEIWKRCDGRTIEEIAVEVAALFGADPHVVGRDVLEYVDQLLDAELVTTV